MNYGNNPALNTPMHTFEVPTVYVVKYKGRTVSVNGRKAFGTYDEARQEVRKVIRRKVKSGDLVRGVDTGYFDNISRNPTRLAGYKIVAV